MLYVVLFLLLILAVLYCLLWLMVPGGKLLHELLRLPPFWLHLLFSPKNNFREERIRYGNHPRQYLLLCIPPEGISLKPAVIFYFHGGGWQFGAPEQFRPHAQQLTQMGYVVLLPSYRRAPRHHYRHIREDLTALLLKAREVLLDKGMEEKKAIIGGMSAGGNLAALAGLGHKALQKAKIPVDWIKGLFLFGAPLHLEKMADTVALRNFAGPREQPMFRLSNPYNYLNKQINIPILIIHGAKDGMVEYPGVLEFANQLKAVNTAETRFFTLPEGTHINVASWFFQEGAVRKAFLNWLAELTSKMPAEQ